MDVLTAVQSKVQLKPNGKRHGGEFVGPCPFCREGNDRFHVWPNHPVWKGGGWWCRICGKKGDFIDFLRQVMGYSYHQACEEMGIEPTKNEYEKPVCGQKASPKEAFRPVKYDDPKEIWAEKAAKFVEYAHETLMGNAGALDKLLRDRGITAEGAKRFKIGMNPSDFYRPREAWGLSTEMNDKTGKPKKLWIPRGLVIPYIVDGKVRRVRIRRPKSDLNGSNGPRYYFVPGSSPEIMLIGKRQRAYVVVESELDGFLIGQEAGDLVGVAALGTASSKPDSCCSDDFTAASVLLVSLDSDAAGEKASGWWVDTFRQAERWPVAEGKDPGDFFRSVDVRSWVIAGLPQAWHIPGINKPPVETPILPEKVEKTKATAKKEASPYPETVMELGELLKRYPVRIFSNRNRLKIDWPAAFRNEEVCNRISRLVYFDPEVSGYIGRHRKERIDGRNFLNG